MRQSDGADLPGANNPPQADTGIIYISPDDARQSVLAAILMQDKVGRKYILLVLPVKTNNNAFSRPVDFDGLKDMRRDLDAQLVIIAPTQSTPAELARQRRSPVYPDLEAFVESLHTSEQSTSAPRKRSVFRRKPENLEPGLAASIPPTPAEEEQQSSTADDDDRVMEFPLVTAPTPVEDEITQETIPAPADAQPVISDTANDVADDQYKEDEEEKIILIPPPPRINPPANYPALVGPASPGGSSAIVPSVRARRSRRWLIAIPIVLILLLIAFFAYQPIVNLIFVPKAVVTITPASKELTNTYTITAVVGNLDHPQSQVQARVLYAASATMQQTVSATGAARTPAVQATGMLTFYNYASMPRTVPAGTVIIGASGVQVVNDASVTIPASALPALGTIAAPAHAVKAGASGNIPANDLNGVTCCGSPDIMVVNLTPFTGGTDAQTNNYVQQSDIDGAANALAASLTAKTQADVTKQVQPGEQLVGSPQCVPVVSSDHAAGVQADTVTVSTSVNCTGEVYDQRGAYTLAENLLMNDPTLNPGGAYEQMGHIVKKIQQVMMGANNSITLRVLAEGVWVYQFNNTQLSALRKLVVGKNQQDAQSLLLKQSGVHHTSIQLYGGNGLSLPSDASQISFFVLNVPGL